MPSLCILLMNYGALQVIPVLKQLNPVPKWLLHAMFLDYRSQGLGSSKGYTRHFCGTGR